MLSIQELDDADKNWNNRLLKTKTGTVVQTKEYGESRKLFEIKPKYITCSTTNGKIVAQLLAFETPRKGKKIFGRLARKIPLKTLSWTFGPVILDNSFNTEISQSFSKFLKTKTFRGSVHPFESNFLLEKNNGFNEIKLGTFIIDLKQNLETILQNTDKKSVRKNIERSKEREVKIECITSNSDVISYLKLLSEHRKKNNLSDISEKEIELRLQGIRMLEKVGQKGFLAFFEDKPIGGIFISTFNNYINEWGIARSKKDQDGKLYSQDLLRWKIIEYGKEKDCIFYDLSGIKIITDDEKKKGINRTPKEKGIYQNKKKWGGIEIQYPLFYK